MRLPVATCAGMLVLAGCAAAPAPATADAGLWDAHTHLSAFGEEALDLLAANGVAGIRDCGSDLEQVARWREEIAAGRRAGPRIFFSGPAVDGPKDAANRLIVTTPEEARRAVDTLRAAGVDFIKTHNAIPRDAYFALLAQASRSGLKVASHVPRGVPAWEAADAGADSIEHAAESLLASPIYAGYAADVEEAMSWWRSSAGDEMIAHLAATGVAVTPTLVTYEAFTELRRGTPAYEPRLRVLAFLTELTGRLHRGGVTILAGSDFAAPEATLGPGTSLAREIELLQEAGLTEAEARAAAGTNVLAWLTREAPAN